MDAVEGEVFVAQVFIAECVAGLARHVVDDDVHGAGVIGPAKTYLRPVYVVLGQGTLQRLAHDALLPEQLPVQRHRYRCEQFHDTVVQKRYPGLHPEIGTGAVFMPQVVVL